MSRPRTTKSYRIGELVYLKDVGYPFDRTDDGGESWEGASCVVTELNSGFTHDMITVELLFPIKCGPGRGIMTGCLFYPSQVVKENRPWLKKHLEQIFESKKKLLMVAREVNALLE
jgi:hypothetical protein